VCNGIGIVGFGTGIHACIGQAVAHLVAELILTALVRRVEPLERCGKPLPMFNITLRG